MRKRLELSTKLLGKTRSEIVILEDSILSKNLEIKDLDDQLKSPPITLPSFMPHSLDSPPSNVTESVENHPISNESRQNVIKNSSRRSRRRLDKSDSEFETEEVSQVPQLRNGSKNEEYKQRLMISSRRSRRLVVHSDSEFETEEAPQSSIPIKGEINKELRLHRSSVDNNNPRNRSSEHKIEKEGNFTPDNYSSENIDSESGVTEEMVINQKIKGDHHFSNESMALLEEPSQRPLGKVHVDYVLC